MIKPEDIIVRVDTIATAQGPITTVTATLQAFESYTLEYHLRDDPRAIAVAKERSRRAVWDRLYDTGGEFRRKVMDLRDDMPRNGLNMTEAIVFDKDICNLAHYLDMPPLADSP